MKSVRSERSKKSRSRDRDGNLISSLGVKIKTAPSVAILTKIVNPQQQQEKVTRLSSNPKLK